jgi:hypothetical protein
VRVHPIIPFLLEALDNGSVYKMIREEMSFKDKNGIWMTRRQLPLTLGYAITVHRTQCMTCSKLVVDLSGINWKPGMFYTILSRRRKLTDIIILAYDHRSFKVQWQLLVVTCRNNVSSSRYLQLRYVKCLDLKSLKEIIRFELTNIWALM